MSPRYQWIVFPYSLNEFIVSDSEEVIVLSDDDVLTPVGSPTQSKSYQTPTTPATGLMFWGSPNENSIQPPRGKAFTCVKERRPFVERSNFFTPSGEHVVCSSNAYTNNCSTVGSGRLKCEHLLARWAFCSNNLPQEEVQHASTYHAT